MIITYEQQSITSIKVSVISIFSNFRTNIFICKMLFFLSTDIFKHCPNDKLEKLNFILDRKEMHVALEVKLLYNLICLYLYWEMTCFHLVSMVVNISLINVHL